MSISKQYTVSKAFEACSKKCLTKHVPSDLIYSLGAALYSNMSKQKNPIKKEFQRKATEKLVRFAFDMRNLEGKYYGG